MKKSALLTLSIEELKQKNVEELEQVAFKYTKVLNQKLRRLEKSGVASFSSAYNAVKQQSKTGKARVQIPKAKSTQAKTKASLINHIKDVQERLRTNKTLSIKETKKMYDKYLKEHFGNIQEANTQEIDAFWSLYGKMKENYPNILYQTLSSEEIVSLAMDYYDHTDVPSVQGMYKYIMNKIVDIDEDLSQQHSELLEVEEQDDIPYIEEQYDLWDF